MRHFLLCFCCFFSLALFSQTTPVPFVDSSWVKPYEPFRVAGNLYYVGTYDLACYLITTPQGHVLINTGLAESVPMIRKNVESLGFNFNDIKILLTTQAHFDHVAGMAEIKTLTRAKMMVEEGDAKVLEDGGNSDFLFGGKGAMFSPVKVDRVLRDGEKITLGGTTITAILHPGHTKGATSFLVDVKDEKRTWRVAIVNMPTILPQTRVMGMPSYPNVGKDYQHTLASLKTLQFDLWVASHASQFNLHDKRKPGDAYNPEVFADKPLFEASVNSLLQEYERRAKEK